MRWWIVRYLHCSLISLRIVVPRVQLIRRIISLLRNVNYELQFILWSVFLPRVVYRYRELIFVWLGVINIDLFMWLVCRAAYENLPGALSCHVARVQPDTYVFTACLSPWLVLMMFLFCFLELCFASRLSVDRNHSSVGSSLLPLLENIIVLF